MKKALLTLGFLTLFFMSSHAQEPITWHTDMNTAFDLATKENKKLMLFFTGSDWCGWCIKLQKEVLKTPVFEEWAKEKMVLVELDFPRRTMQSPDLKNQNHQMQQMFKVRGYPSVVFVSPEKTQDGKKNLRTLGQTGYVRGGAEKWLEAANSIVQYK